MAWNKPMAAASDKLPLQMSGNSMKK